MSPCLFLDRDGVINIDTGYVHKSADFHFVDGIFDLCRAARALKMQIHVVTNQAGIGRGLYSEADFQALSTWMRGRFAEQGAALDAVHHCPHHPEHGTGAYRRACARRKPGPGMLLDAAAGHGLDLPHSMMVGDKATDMQAALAAGLGTRVLFSPDAAERAACPAGTVFVDALRDAIPLLAAAIAGT